MTHALVSQAEIEGSEMFDIKEPEKFMAAWLNALYIEGHVELELQPGDGTRYLFCAQLVDTDKCRIMDRKIIWHDCRQDRYMILPDEILCPDELLRYMTRNETWNPYTLAVLASLHYAYADFFLAARDSVCEQYETRYYDWEKAEPTAEGLCKLLTSSKESTK